MLYALDLETACNVPGCKHFGESMCAEGHSLSPWHSVITVIGITDGEHSSVLRGKDMIPMMTSILSHMKDSGSYFTAHSGKFDVLHLAQKGVPLSLLFDTWKSDTHLLAFVWTDKIPQEWLDEYASNKPKHQRAAGQHSLKTLAPYFLGVQPYWELENKDDDRYVLTDTEHTHRLETYLRREMPKDQQEFVDEKLLPWTKMLIEAELRGLKVDVDGLLKYKDELEIQESALHRSLDAAWVDAHEAYARLQTQAVNRRYDSMKNTKSREQRRAVALSRVETKVSYDSPTQLLWLLGEHYGYDVRSLEGQLSTAKDVLVRLAEEGKEDVALLLKWRKTQKLLTAFIPSLLDFSSVDGSIHPIFNPTGARTGRLSAERPNVQQIPKDLKRFFNPGEGRVLLGYDAKAIEAKLIAIYSQDKNFCEIVLSGQSFHDFNAKAFFELDCDVSEVAKKYPKERRAAKTIGFACIFGAGANRIRIAMNQAGFSISQNEAKRIYRRYRETYAEAFEYAESVVATFESGEVVHNVVGRPLKIQNQQDCFMRSMNLMVQSSASDLNLANAHALLNALRAEGIDAIPHMFIHDALYISVPEEHAEKANSLALNEILLLVSLPTKFGDVTIDYEGGYAKTWE